ncbi:HMG box protein [Leptodontidium sp. 2 PMI_412]|nr:HMG box protein [Leptodontidium sp. 2 PMI_412]
MAAQSKLSGPPQFISKKLSGRPLQGHPHSRAPLREGEFTHWFENEVSLQVSDVNFMVTIPMSKLNGWTAKAQEYMVAIYSKLTGHDDCILVRCNKLPRVFIAPRHFFDTQAKYLEVAGDLPIIVDEDSAVCSNFSTIPDTEYNTAAPGAPVVDSSNDGHGPSVPAANPARVGRNGVPRPPNCFILFRQHLHPLVVRDNPGVHNNEISAIISKMWHSAPAMVIEQYRDLAKNAKAAHRLLHPNYNYCPRRSSEKKRRMSKKKAAALEAATAQAGQQLAQSGGTFDAVLPTSSATRGDLVNHNVSAGNSSMEPQGSGMGLELVDDNAAVQVEDLGAASGAFVPREDFEVHISGDNPELAYVDMSLDAANHDRYYTDFTSQGAFAEIYQELNGDSMSTPIDLPKFPTFSNQLYDFESQTYDHDLQGVFFGED